VALATTRPFALAFAVAILACGVDSDGSTEVRDSSGIRIIESPDLPPDSDTWQLDSIPALTIGDETRGEAHIFSGIGGAVRMSDGRIAVADQRAAEVRVFEESGELVTRFARRGEGPGEFGFIVGLYLLPGDTLVAQNHLPPGPLGVFQLMVGLCAHND
jgi:outer membrane protein assembly factor BamB